VSLRSVDQFPCNEMAAQFFNGGGHLNASGGRLNCSMEEAVRITEKAIEAFESLLKP
jgi:phosphoesterase RecJ-like protein